MFKVKDVSYICAKNRSQSLDTRQCGVVCGSRPGTVGGVRKVTPEVTQGTVSPRPQLRQKPLPSPAQLSSYLELSVSPAPGDGGLADHTHRLTVSPGARGLGREPPAGLGTGVDACSQGGQHGDAALLRHVHGEAQLL